MPRIRDNYLNCVIYLYPSEQFAEEGARIGGSGFLVGMPIEELGIWFIYAITNKHVIEQGSTVIRANNKNAGVEIMATDERAWQYHPAGDDLAALPIRFDWTSVRLNFVSIDQFMTSEIVSEFNIGPGDEAFAIGRFINHEGRQQNLPTVRFGCIAQMPHEPIRQETGFEQESFLVEARSIGGYSGSPVFAFIPALSEREVENWGVFSKVNDSSELQMRYLASHGPWLLGVTWGHLNDWGPVCDRVGRPVNHTDPHAQQVKVNTGMMAVVPAWKLAALLHSTALVEQRNTILERVRKERENNAPSATSD